MQTSETLELTTLSRSTSSQEDSRVRTSASPAREQVSTENDPVFGESSLEWFASYDPDTCSWKTPQLSLFGGSETYSRIWPSSGTMQNGRCYPRAPWVLHTHGRGCSLWHTVTAQDCKPAGPVETEMVRRYLDGERIPNTYIRLRSQVAAREGRTGRLNPEWVEWLMGFPRNWTAID